MLNEVEIIEHSEQIDIPVERCPWREGHECWNEDKPCLAKQPDDSHEVGARVSFVKNLENTIVYRFDSTCNEQASRIAKQIKISCVL